MTWLIRCLLNSWDSVDVEARADFSLEFDPELQDFTIVPRAVPVRHVLNRAHALEDTTRLDPTFQHIGQQLLDIRAHGCKAPAIEAFARDAGVLTIERAFRTAL